MNELHSTWRTALLQLALFLAGSALWMAGLVTAVAASGLAGDGSDLGNALGPGLLGGITALQIAGLCAWALVLAVGARSPGGFVGVLGLGGAPLRWWAAAFVGGLTVWMLPSWFASWLIEATGADDSTVEQITQLLSTEPLSITWPLIAAIVVVAPVCEEVIFRGYLWHVIDSPAGAMTAWLVTTLLFAMYHLDPIQAAALLPTALFLGWIRLASGSIGPAILAHAVNNFVGVWVARSLDPTTTADLASGLPFALIGGAITLTAAVAPLRRKRP